jgi:hypothetical protein
MPCEANFGVMIGLESVDVDLGYAAGVCLFGIHSRKAPSAYKVKIISPNRTSTWRLVASRYDSLGSAVLARIRALSLVIILV